jgi:hypothetical protein
MTVGTRAVGSVIDPTLPTSRATRSLAVRTGARQASACQPSCRGDREGEGFFPPLNPMQGKIPVGYDKL